MKNIAFNEKIYKVCNLVQLMILGVVVTSKPYLMFKNNDVVMSTKM